ncbi:MAG: PAS domain S-box protein [Halobacteriales archaeon]
MGGIDGGTDRSIAVLHVEPDHDFASMAANLLEREGRAIAVTPVASADEAFDHLERSEVDCIVSDYDMPGTDGLTFLSRVRERNPDLPFVLFTGMGSEEIAAEAISAGVTDYLEKGGGPDQFAILANQITNAVETYRSQRSLRESERRLSLFVDQSPLGVIEWDETFGFRSMNPAAERILGFDEATLREAGWEVIVPPAERPRVESVAEQLLADRGGYHLVNENVTADGDRIVCEWHNRVVTDGDGRVLSIFSLFQDITERVERERTVALERDRLQSLIETIPEPVARTRFEGGEPIIEAINPAYERVFGVDADGAIGRSNNEIVVPADRRGEAATIDRRTREGEVVIEEVQRRATDGLRDFLMRVVPVGQSDGPIEEAFVTYVDFTDRKRREQALEAMHAVASSIQHAASVEMVCEETVQAAEEILDLHMCSVILRDGDHLEPVALSSSAPSGGAKRVDLDEGVVGRTLRRGESELVPNIESDAEASPAVDTYRSGLSIPIGDRGVFQAVSTEAEGFDESDLGLAELLIAHTTTALDRLDRERELERQNERLDRFARIVSHDLRSPLAVADGHLELLSEHCEDEHLDGVRRAHDRMEALLEDTLALARQGRTVAETEPIDLAEIVESCRDVVEQGDGSLEVVGSATIEADKRRLRQILENLLSNAVTHAGEGVRVRVGPLEEGGFFVVDDGPGIPRSIRERLFEPGVTTAEDSTGFGLAIVAEIAEALGWRVSVEEGSAGGARFEFTDVEIVRDGDPTG